jgi:hypothetical protein
MSTETAPLARGAPWHLSLVAAIAILWNGYGGYDYVMRQLQGAAYYRRLGMTEAQIAFMAGYPVWMDAVWAVGVWSAVAGSVLLLLRSRWALSAFVLSLVGFLASSAYALATPGGAAVISPVMSLVIAGGCLFFIWYAWAMSRAGVLR